MAEKILLVDDDPDTISLFNLLLARQGFQVVVAKTGVEALELAHKELPDLIILDIMLPGVDGFDVAVNLHRTPDTATIPILMVTARTAVEDKIKGYEVGADIYLTKPVQQMDLLANIRVLLMQRKARKVDTSSHGYVVGVLAARGGLGVSTVALSLAVSDAKKYGEKVIAAELRPGHGCWVDELHLAPDAGLSELLKLNAAQITPAVVESHLVGTDYRVRMLLASNLSDEPVLSSETGQYEEIISGLSSLAALVVLDIGGYFSAAFPQIIERCNELVVVTEPQPVAVKQTARLLDLLRNHGVGTTRPLNVLSVNHTRSDTTLSISQIEELLKRPVTLGVPPALELSSHAMRVGMPMVMCQPESLMAQQINKLTETVKRHRESL